jgi:hypothetical protein
VHLKPAVRHARERHELALAGLVNPNGMPLAEGAASGILTRQAHGITF